MVRHPQLDSPILCQLDSWRENLAMSKEDLEADEKFDDARACRLRRPIISRGLNLSMNAMNGVWASILSNDVIKAVVLFTLMGLFLCVGRDLVGSPLFTKFNMAMGTLLLPAAFSDSIFRNTTMSKVTAFLVIQILAACGFLLGLIYGIFIKYEYMDNTVLNRLINTLVGGVVLGAAMGAAIVAVKRLFDKS